MKPTIAAFIAPLLAATPSQAPMGESRIVAATLHCPARPPSGTCLASWHPYRLGDQWAKPWGTIYVCASRDLEKGTWLRVTRGTSCIEVVVADWGPAERTGRDLDLSREAFAALGPPSVGVMRVHWQVLRGGRKCHIAP